MMAKLIALVKDIVTLSNEYDVSVSDLLRELADLYDEDFVQEDPELETKRDKIRFAWRCIEIDVMAGGDVNE